MSADENQVWAQDFLFGAPLYAEYDITSFLAREMFGPLTVDGHCP
jgi:hypothetical protein